MLHRITSVEPLFKNYKYMFVVLDNISKLTNIVSYASVLNQVSVTKYSYIIFSIILLNEDIVYWEISCLFLKSKLLMRTNCSVLKAS